MELIQSIGERIFSDAGLTAFVLFMCLVASNYYHVRVHMANRKDIAAAWEYNNTSSDKLNTTLGQIQIALGILVSRKGD